LGLILKQILGENQKPCYPSPVAGSRFHAGTGGRNGEAKAKGDIFAWIGRNPLKSPESDEGIQENPNLFALESLPFSLDSFGILWWNLDCLGFLG
jgi:hypothetical protein